MEISLLKSEEEKILSYVRSVIGSAISGGNAPEMPDIPLLEEKMSCFVTLHLDRELRGCIGAIEAFEPLGENLKRNAVNAAFRDPRFPPLTADEFRFTEIEVSLLSTPERISGPDEFEIGRDGIIFSLFGSRAVFLPQVPVEQNWDKETTLTFLARKAGLPGNAWQSKDSLFYTFTTKVIS